MNLPNSLTLGRVLAVPIVMLLLQSGEDLWALFLFILAAVTDFFDGVLARRWNQITQFGKFVDPLADKLLLLGALVALQDLGRVSSWIVFALLSRELAVTTLRVLAMGQGLEVAAGPLGKVKTVAQMVALGALILRESFDVGPIQLDFALLGTLVIWVATALAWISAGAYLRVVYRGTRAA
ncbi:MAG: CDP-diacylglycerol--glycerol-3-phosphate 3-phosphatidyltransferase [Myxococcota bacterium]